MFSDKKPDISKQSKSRVRVTITATSVKPLEKVSDDLVQQAKEKNLKILRITTRKTPCGEGSKTWDRYQMRIHKRVIDLLSSDGIAEQLTYINLEPGVNCEVKIAGI
ncbi:unnamed protein product [Protopolystoma xenopodis]|uniref:Small ribosomal subunit protein uS10 domain-containing protein n=1 Tax=Protopolystoma xenopodis TaxID=117903 RepID=A0A448WKT4_9PLAT|nr:unnamed protein product [Protopolystoma xenopodis]